MEKICAHSIDWGQRVVKTRYELLKKEMRSITSVLGTCCFSAISFSAIGLLSNPALS
jgi:hypothetical protein